MKRTSFDQKRFFDLLGELFWPYLRPKLSVAWWWWWWWWWCVGSGNKVIKLWLKLIKHQIFCKILWWFIYVNLCVSVCVCVYILTLQIKCTISKDTNTIKLNGRGYGNSWDNKECHWMRVDVTCAKNNNPESKKYLLSSRCCWFFFASTFGNDRRWR